MQNNFELRCGWNYAELRSLVSLPASYTKKRENSQGKLIKKNKQATRRV